MADTAKKQAVIEETAVDDVRRIREQIDRESGGDLKKHVEQTNRIVEEYREKLGLNVLQPRPQQDRRDGTRGR
jgi:hypothetical protein